MADSARLSFMYDLVTGSARIDPDGPRETWIAGQTGATGGDRWQAATESQTAM